MVVALPVVTPATSTYKADAFISWTRCSVPLGAVVPIPTLPSPVSVITSSSPNVSLSNVSIFQSQKSMALTALSLLLCLVRIEWPYPPLSYGLLLYVNIICAESKPARLSPERSCRDLPLTLLPATSSHTIGAAMPTPTLSCVTSVSSTIRSVLTVVSWVVLSNSMYTSSEAPSAILNLSSSLLSM